MDLFPSASSLDRRSRLTAPTVARPADDPCEDALCGHISAPARDRVPAAGRIALADRVRHAASGRPLEVAHGKQCGQVTARRALPRRAALLRRLAGYDGVAWETIVSDGADDGVSALGVGVLVVALLFAGMPGWAGAQDTDSRADDALGCDLALLFSDEQLGKRNIDLRELCGFQLFNECRPVPVIIRTEDAGPDTDRHIRAVAEGHLRPAQIYGPPPRRRRLTCH